MKKILSLLTALALSLALVACTPPDNGDSGNGGNENQEPINPPSDIETPNYPVTGDWN